MAHKNVRLMLGEISPLLTVGAMILGALVADLLSGTVQVFVLGLCLSVMALGVLASITKPSLEPDMSSAALHIEAKLAATAKATSSLRAIGQPVHVKAAESRRPAHESQVAVYH